MEPATYSLGFAQEPPGLLERLEAVLAGQGTPTLSVALVDGSYVFAGGESMFMLKARSADALTTVYPGWQMALLDARDESR